VCYATLQFGLRQLDDASVEQQPTSEEFTDGDWLCTGSGGPGQSVAEVVGPTPTQLESSDELIRLDHEYYRTAAPVCSEEVVCEVEVCAEEDTADLPEAAVLPCDLDLSVLTDPDLWNHLEQIIDADQLLGLDYGNPPTSEISQPPPPPPEELISTSPKPAESSLPSYCVEGFGRNSPIYDSLDTFSVEPWSLHSSGSNNLESSSSGVGSPWSDEIVDSEDYGFHWEESFMELFPSLV